MNSDFSLADSFRKVIENGSTIADVTVDWLCHDDGLRNIPFVSTVVSLYRICDTIHERHTVRKLADFIQTVANGSCDEKKRARYLTGWHANRKKRNDELEYLIIIIDRLLHREMARMLARVYLSFLEGKINWEEVLRFSVVIDRLLPGDYEALKRGNRENVSVSDTEDAVLRLIGLGLMVSHGKDMQMQQMESLFIPISSSSDYTITDFGNKFMEAIE